MALSKLIPVGLGAVTLMIIFGYTMWKSPIKNFSILRKRYLKIKFKGAIKPKKVVKEVTINGLSSEEEHFDDAIDAYDETDDEFHDAEETPFELMKRTELFAMVDCLSLKDSTCQLEGLNLLRRYEKEFGSSEPDFLWRIAQSIRNKSVIEKAANNTKKQTELLIEARTYAKTALDIDETNGHAHKWYALLCGEIGQHLSLREQVNAAKIFKDHLHIAYTSLPDDCLINHALGTFEYEACSRSYLERTAAKLIFGKLFDVSISAAVEYLTASEHARPSKRNRLYLARCYLYDNVLPTAHSWLRKALKLPTVTPEDYLIEEEILEVCRDKRLNSLGNLFCLL